MAKIFVEVTAKYNVDGTVRPLSLKLEDGHIFEVDRLIDVRRGQV